MTAATLVRRLIVVAALPALAFAGSAGAAVGLTGPRRLVQGGDATITAAVRSGVRSRSRSDTAADRSARRHLHGRQGDVSFQVPRRAATGRARATVSCAGAGTASLSMMVIGSVIPAKITVVKQGFSQRLYTYGGSTASWGVILSNQSPDQDALDVKVLANFVMPDNRLIASATVRVASIPAGGTYVSGGSVWFSGAPPIARLRSWRRSGDATSPNASDPRSRRRDRFPTPASRVGSVGGG